MLAIKSYAPLVAKHNVAPFYLTTLMLAIKSYAP